MNSSDQNQIEKLKQAAIGREIDILRDVAGIPVEYLDGRHHPCPECGGKDRFRLIDADAGAVLCNQCFFERNGDFPAAIMWALGVELAEAMRRVAAYLQTSVGDASTQPSKTAAKSELCRHERQDGRAKKGKPPLGNRLESYIYRDDLGTEVLRVDRHENKEFLQLTPDDRGGWKFGSKGIRVVPYRLPEILANPNADLWIVEGEKDANNLAQRLGVLATTNAGGAGKWTAAHAEWLRGRPGRVFVTGDNDADGRKHEGTVCDALCGVVDEYRVVRFPSLPEKGDATDWLDAGGTREELDRLAEEAFRRTSRRIVDRPLNPPVPRYEPFPVDALPKVAADLVRSASRAMGCDPANVAIPALVAMAGTIGNRYRLQLKAGWTVPPILWGVVIGASGTLKTPAFQAALKPIWTRHERTLAEHQLACEEYHVRHAEWERAATAYARSAKDAARELPTEPAKPILERHVTSDTTIERLAGLLETTPYGMLLARDELNGWFASFDKYSARTGGAPDSSHWLSLYNGNVLSVDRKSLDKPTLYVRLASLSIVGGIQPETFRKALGKAHRDSGLAARLLVASPPKRTKQWSDVGLCPSTEAAYASLIDRLAAMTMAMGEDGLSEPRLVQFGSEAKAIYTDFYDRHNEEAVELDGDEAASWSKLEEIPARIALIHHLARIASCDDVPARVDLVDRTSVLAGIALTQWFKREAERLYRELAETDEQRQMRSLVAWIEGRGGRVCARDVQRALRRYESAQLAEKALASIASAGYGYLDWNPRNEAGGRPLQVLQLFDWDDVDTTPSKPAETEVLSTNPCNGTSNHSVGGAAASHRAEAPDVRPVGSDREEVEL